MKFYLTFGQDHPLRNGWVEIEALTYEEARKLAFDNFGRFWSNVYTTYEDFKKECYLSGKIGETLK